MNAIVRAGQDAAAFLRDNSIWVFLLGVSIVSGLVLVLPPHEAAPLAILAIAPVILVQMAIIRNIFIGVVLFLVFEYLRPGDLFSPIGAIRPTLLLSVALLGAWILNLMRHRLPLVINWQVKSYLVFFVLAFFSLFVAISQGMVARASIELAKTLIILCVMFSVVRTPAQFLRLTWVYIILHVILAVRGFSIFATAGERRLGNVGGGFLGDENDSAMALVIMIPYMYFLLPATRGRLARLVLIAGMIFAALAVLFSFSRGAFIGFMSMVLYMWSKSEKRLKAGIVIVLAITIFFAVMPGEYWDRIESMKNYATEGSAQGRLDAWKGGIRMMLDNPLFGCGIGNFSRTYGTQYNTISTRWTAAHSMYIEFIGQLGVPGLIFLVAVIVLTFRTFHRARDMTRGIVTDEARTLKQVMIGAECGFVTYLVTTFFLSSMFYPHLWLFGAMAGMGLEASRSLVARERPALREVPVAPELT